MWQLIAAAWQVLAAMWHILTAAYRFYAYCEDARLDVFDRWFGCKPWVYWDLYTF